MPVCTVSNPTWATSPIINPTPTSVAFSVAANQTLHFELSNNQTVYFKFQLVASINNPFDSQIQISIYRASDFTLVSTLTSFETLIDTNIDLTTGIYIICMRALKGSFSGTAVANYYGYSRTIQLSSQAYESAQSCNFTLTIAPRPKPCAKPMKWELVEGSLPPGLVLAQGSGMIYGTLPYLDCLNDSSDPFNNIPSATMFRTLGLDENQTLEPWGRRFKFKLKISILDQPEHYAEQWFCVSIYNDWTRTQRKFFNLNTHGEIELTDFVIPKKKYDFGLCPPDKNKIEIDVSKHITNIIKDWQGVTSDDDIRIIELVEPDLKSIDNIETNTYIEFNREEGKYQKVVETIEYQDQTVVYGPNGAFISTIDMDEDIIDLSNIASDDVSGYIHEHITIEIDSYDQYLGFRQWCLYNKNDSKISEYIDTQLFQDFMNGSVNVRYEYMFYSPTVGVDFDGEIDLLDLTDGDRHYIYIEYNNIDLPEPKYIMDTINKAKEHAPIDLEHFNGETVNFALKV